MNRSRDLTAERSDEGPATGPEDEPVRSLQIELCVQMETLAQETAIDPREKAKAIKELQQAWQALGASDTREGQRLWHRFKEAGDAAFAPCAEFFESRRSEREANAKRREDICARIEHFAHEMNWNSPNWKAIANTINKAKADWQKTRDIPHSCQRQLQSRFDKTLAPMQKKLKEEQARNHALKQSLVERAKQYASGDAPLSEAVGTIKSLQKEWKTVGVTERRRDQKLWKAFRAQCDIVFARRDAKREAKAEASNPAPEPREQSKPRGQETEQKRATLAEIKRKAAICIQLEAGQIGPVDAASTWEGDVELPKEVGDALAVRKARAASGDRAGTEANADAAARLCVQLEMLAGIESPPAQQPLRMQLQVERLNRELSRGEKDRRAPIEQARSILVDWYCMGPLPEGSGALTERFYRAERSLFGDIPASRD